MGQDCPSVLLYMMHSNNNNIYIYVCRHICVCLCVICMPSEMMPDVFYLSDSPASWWRFAFNVVLSRVTEHTRRQTWAFVASRAQLNVRYVRAYTRKLTDPVLDADMSVSCHLCVSAASLCVPMCGASLCVPMCGASLCVFMCGGHLLACLFCFVCFHLSYLVWEGGGCSFTPMLVNSDGWDGDHSSPGGGSCMMHLLLLLIVRVHLHKYCVLAVKPPKAGFTAMALLRRRFDDCDSTTES